MATLTLIPNGVGDETAIPNLVGAATHWQAVLTSDGDTSYVETPDVNDTWYRDLYDIETTEITGTISSVTVYAVGRIGQPASGFSSGIIYLSLQTYATVYEVLHSTGLPSDAYGSVSNAWTTNPNTGNAWTWAEIAALQIGINLRRSHIFSPPVPRWARVTQVYVVVTYTAYTTAASSVTTQGVTDTDKTTATGNGNVTNLGVPAATQHGHCWATFPNPTIAQPTTHTTTGGRTENGVPSATGDYTSSLTTLEQNKKYYCRAYITNSVGTFYGAEVDFTTLADVPVVTTDLVTKIAATTALGNGSIDNNGGSAITQHGVCWSTSANPTTDDSHTTEGVTSVIGDFHSLMTGLTANLLYHVRAYAINSANPSDPGYGDDETFTTMPVGAPIVTTQRSTNVEATTATGRGTIVDIGGNTVTEHGHCWSTSANPTTTPSGDSPTTLGAGVVGDFSSEITGLTAGTKYYIRAYATNSYGTGYGDNDVISEIAEELKGNLAYKNEFLCYTDKSGTQRALLGVAF